MIIDNGYLPEVVCKNLITIYNNYTSFYYDVNKTWVVEIKNMRIKNIKEIKPVIFNLEKKYSFLKEAKLVNNQIVKLPEGSYHPEHYDRRKNEIDKWAFFLYLNDDFKGGELVVEGKEIIPEIGKLVIFEAGKIKHKVNKVLKGNRYTLAGWYI